jgi:hypothetical protein
MPKNEKSPPAQPSSAKEKPKKDEMLDEAIADSMIASDPPAPVSKGHPTSPRREAKHRHGK